MISFVALALGGGAQLSCASTPDAAASSPAATPTEQNRAQLRVHLRTLPAIEGEDFPPFLARLEATLLAEDKLELAALIRALPRSRALWTTPTERALVPLLLGAYARSSTQEATLEALRSLVRHPTVNAGDATSPGRGPAFDAMEADVKERAQALGLVFDHVNHTTWLVGIVGKDKKLPHLAASIGVLTHGDVVPATEKEWRHDPFAGIMEEDRLVARGSLDDKAPIAAVMSAIATLAQTNIPLVRPPVLLIGTSEETHWAGIEQFQQQRTIPPVTIVADGSFPLGVGEKGIASVRLEAKGNDSLPGLPQVLAFDSGVVANQVAGAGVAVVRPAAGTDAVGLIATLEAARESIGGIDATFTVAGEGDAARITVAVVGKEAHSAEPEMGHSAATDLVALLVRGLTLSNASPSACVRLLVALDDSLGRTFSGVNLGVTDRHPKFSPSTVNLGLLSMEQGAKVCRAKLNVRWPPPRTADAVVASVCARMKPSFVDGSLTCLGGGLDPFLIEEKSDVVATLQTAYREVFQADAKPITLSGTTYAKAIKGAVTFGPEPARDAGARRTGARRLGARRTGARRLGARRTGARRLGARRTGALGLGGRMHAANEFITTEELADLIEVYTFALASLALGPALPVDDKKLEQRTAGDGDDLRARH